MDLRDRDTDELIVYLELLDSDRHLLDAFRTIIHELKHEHNYKTFEYERHETKREL